MARGILRTPLVTALAGTLLMSGAASSESLLLVADSTGDKFWAFSAVDGRLISSNYIPDDGRMVQPRQCVRLPSGSWYIGEQGGLEGCSAADAIIEHSSPGIFVRRVQDQSTGICDPNAICLRDGKVWIGRGDSIANSVGGANGIYSMNLDGTGLAAVSVPPNLVSLRGMAPVPGGFVVADYWTVSVTGQPTQHFTRLWRIASDGGSVTLFHEPAPSGLRLPGQVAPMANGGVVVAGFSGESVGLHFFNADGSPGTPAYYRTQGPSWTVFPPRGCYPLENGRVLYSGGTVVGVVDPVMQEEFIVVNAIGGSQWGAANFSVISKVDVPDCPADLDRNRSVNGDDLGILLVSWGPGGGSADLTGDGSVNGDDLGLLLVAWGACGN